MLNPFLRAHEKTTRRIIKLRNSHLDLFKVASRDGEPTWLASIDPCRVMCRPISFKSKEKPVIIIDALNINNSDPLRLWYRAEHRSEAHEWLRTLSLVKQRRDALLDDIIDLYLSL